MACKCVYESSCALLGGEKKVDPLFPQNCFLCKCLVLKLWLFRLVVGGVLISFPEDVRYRFVLSLKRSFINFHVV